MGPGAGDKKIGPLLLFLLWCLQRLLTCMAHGPYTRYSDMLFS